MPSIQIMMNQGCPEERIEKLMRAMPGVVCSTLENTLVRMVRVSVYETRPEYVRQGQTQPEQIIPTVSFYLGPGRSEEAIRRCLEKMAQSFEECGVCPRENVRIYIMTPQPKHFAIDGTIR